MPKLDVAVSGSVTKTTTQNVATDHARVVALMVTIDPIKLILEIEFGNGSGGGFGRERQEVWIGQGTNVSNLLGQSPSGVTYGAVLRDLAETAVSTIQGNSTLKQNMVAAGDLIIFQGSIDEFLAGKYVP